MCCVWEIAGAPESALQPWVYRKPVVDRDEGQVATLSADGVCEWGSNRHIGFRPLGWRNARAQARPLPGQTDSLQYSVICTEHCALTPPSNTPATR